MCASRPATCSAARLGFNDGWRAAMHTLANERNMIGSAAVEEDLDAVVALARERGLDGDPVVRQELAR